MQRELGQLSLADGPGRRRRGTQPAAGADRGAGRLGGVRAAPLRVYAAPVGRPIGPIRAPVERTFAILKRWYGYRRVRYRSLINNALQLQLLAVALNLRRALVLTG
jgi:IS5 family transposase